MAQCQDALRLKPIGCDRNHARYWVFNGVAAGLYIEHGWRNLEDLSRTAEEVSKEMKEVEGTEELEKKETVREDGSDIVMVEETKDENKMDSHAEDSVKESR